MSTEPKWCESWTSHDDVGGEGEQTFYHECSQPEGHQSRHQCMGHRSEFDGEWERCNHDWHNYHR